MFITKTKTNSLHFYYRLEIKTGLTDGETILTNHFLFSTKHHQLTKKKKAYSIQNHQQNRHEHSKTQDSAQTTSDLAITISNFWRDRRCRGPKVIQSYTNTTKVIQSYTNTTKVIQSYTNTTTNHNIYIKPN